MNGWKEVVIIHSLPRFACDHVIGQVEGDMITITWHDLVYYHVTYHVTVRLMYYNAESAKRDKIYESRINLWKWRSFILFHTLNVYLQIYVKLGLRLHFVRHIFEVNNLKCVPPYHHTFVFINTCFSNVPSKFLVIIIFVFPINYQI